MDSPLNNTTFLVPKEPHKDEFFPFISILVISALTLLCNSIVFFVMLTNRGLLQRNSNKFVLNLTLSNTCVTAVMLCFSASVIGLNQKEHTYGNHNEPAPEISLMFGVLILLSVMNMIVLSGDRLCAIKFTYYYFNATTSKQIKIAMIVPWVASAIYFITLMTLLKTGDEGMIDIVKHAIYYSFDVVALLGFVMLLTSNSVIYREAQNQLTKIRKTSVRGSANENELDFKERRLAFINVALVVKFVCFWIPTLATMNYHLIWETSASKGVEFFAIHMVLFNCVCDPTVYIVLSKDIRKAIISMFYSTRICSNKPSKSGVTEPLKSESSEV